MSSIPRPSPIRLAAPVPRDALMLVVALLALLALTVWGVLQDRRQAIARERANGIAVAQGVQQFATELIGQSFDTLRQARRDLAIASAPVGETLTAARRHDHATAVLGVRSATGEWLAVGADGPLPATPGLIAALEEGARGANAPEPRLEPAVFVAGFDWCLPIRLNLEDDPRGTARVVALVPVRRLLEASASIRLLAGGHVIFTTPAGARLFRYFENTGRVDVDRSPISPTAQARLRSGAQGSFELTGLVTGQWTHFGFSASQKVPLVVVVAVAEPSIERAWLSRSAGQIGGLLAASAATVFFAWRLTATRRALAGKSSQYRQLSESLDDRAAHDPLTGLLNRHAFLSRVQQSIDQRPGRPLGIVALDLNRFKEVNESLGHAAGDAVLQALGDRLRARYGDSSGCIARLGGDGLALCVPLAARSGQVDALCTDLYDTIAAPQTIRGVALTVTASLGAAVYPDDSALPAELLRCAEMAMFEAKRSLRPHERYGPALDRVSTESLALRCDFAHALRSGGLSLVYQPKVATATGELVGVEALARWMHPTKGAISPAEFVPLAETTELIHPFTEHVLRCALEQCAAWQRSGRGVPVAVNVSVNNLMDPNFVALVGATLARCGVPPAMLELEVTEGSLARNPEVALTRLLELRQLGVALSIDDFGTGYSSLAYLKRLPVDALKLDRSFTKQLATDAGDRRIVESTIQLGHGFGMKVVAEGVETVEIAALLTTMGCDISQGYYYGRPMPPAELHAQWLATVPEQ